MRQRPLNSVERTVVVSIPLRIQLSRKAGWRMAPNTQKVDRSTKWGNPFVAGKEIPFLPGRKVQDKRHSVSLYAGYAPQQPHLVAAARAELAGKNLACWCRLCDIHRNGQPMVGARCPDCDPCHADTLGRIASGEIRCEEA